jgi:hypothetical protein
MKRDQAEREPDLLNKLDEIMERVVISRSEKPADNEEVWASGGALGGDKVSALAGECCITVIFFSALPCSAVLRC